MGPGAGRVSAGAMATRSAASGRAVLRNEPLRGPALLRDKIAAEAAQAKHIVGAVRTLDPVETAGRSGNHDTKVSHCESPVIWKQGNTTPW